MKRFTERQGRLYHKLVDIGARTRWVTHRQIQEATGPDTSPLWIALRRLGCKLGGTERLMTSVYGYFLQVDGIPPPVGRRKDIRTLNAMEARTLEAIVELGGVGKFVKRSAIEKVLGCGASYTLRWLELRLDQVEHEFRLQSRIGRGYRLWPRNDARWETFR